MKLLNGSHVENNHFYIGFVYIPHENNVFYRKNELDLFSLLIEDISVYKEKGSVIVSGDFNSRIGTCPDFIENDVIDYNCDIPMPSRESQDLVVNSFGRKLLDLCRSTCTRVCNGRTFGDKNGKYTFLITLMQVSMIFIKLITVLSKMSMNVFMNVSNVYNDAITNTKHALLERNEKTNYIRMFIMNCINI